MNRKESHIERNGNRKVGNPGIAFLTSMTNVSAKVKITDGLRASLASHLGGGILDSEMTIQLLCSMA